MSYALSLAVTPAVRRSVDDGSTTVQEAEAAAARALASGQKLGENAALLRDAVSLARQSIQEAIDRAVTRVREAADVIARQNEDHKANVSAMEDAYYGWDEPSQTFTAAYENCYQDADDEVGEAQDFISEFAG